MKLDMDLVRAILLKAEAAPANEDAGEIKIEGFDEDRIAEHIELMHERGLLEARIMKSGMGEKRLYFAEVNRLTWEGHEFVQSARNDQVWSRVKALVKSKGGSVSFEILKEVLTKAALSHFNLG